MDDRRLTPNAVARDFSLRRTLGSQTCRALYEAALREGGALDAAYGAWYTVFGEKLRDQRRAAGARAALGKLGAQLGLAHETLQPPRLLFALHTFYGLVAQGLLERMQGDAVGLGATSGRGHGEAGGLLEWIHWPTEIATQPLEQALAEVTRIIAAYDPSGDGAAAGFGNRNGQTEAGHQASVDLLKPLYHQLVPRAVRRLMGEYYTPDWLAARVLQLAEQAARSFLLSGQAATNLRSGAVKLTDEGAHLASGVATGHKAAGEWRPGRLLDPACGTGTFLALAVRRAVQQGLAAGIPPETMRRGIVENIVGIDLNPLAVLAARTNYLWALGDAVRRAGGAWRVPVYCADVILAPPQLEPFDIVVGNPPWITWDTLPAAYRRETLPLWHEHGLFVHRGMDAILGKGKKDLAMLLTYAVADRFLIEGGALAFVLAQAVFKTAGAAQGFRRFVTRSGAPLECVAVEDYAACRVFNDAAAKAAVLVLRKGRPTVYPVPYRLAVARVPALEGAPQFVLHQASPADAGDATSAWLTSGAIAAAALRKILGKSPYRAVLGVNTGGANAIYWFEILKELGDGVVLARNVVETAKRKLPVCEVPLERALLYPLLRARDVAAWRAAPRIYVLMVQDSVTRRGLSEEQMRAFPLARAWLERQRDLLRARAALRRYFGAADEAFWSMFNVGGQVFSPWKVVWPRLARRIVAAVVSPHEGQPVLAQETVSLIGLADAEEAHYLAGVLNSGPFRAAVESFSQPGSKSFGTPGILQKAYVPRFQRANALHAAIASLARQLGEATEREADDGRTERLDALCGALWGLTAEERRGISATENGKNSIELP